MLFRFAQGKLRQALLRGVGKPSLSAQHDRTAWRICALVGREGRQRQASCQPGQPGLGIPDRRYA